MKKQVSAVPSKGCGLPSKGYGLGWNFLPFCECTFNNGAMTLEKINSNPCFLVQIEFYGKIPNRKIQKAWVWWPKADI